MGEGCTNEDLYEGEKGGGEKVNEDNKKEWIRSGPMFLCALECER